MLEEEIYNREVACKALKEMKNLEKKTKLHKYRINDNTVVFCKNEDDITLYKQKYNK